MDGLEIAKLILESPTGIGGSTLRDSFLKAAKVRTTIPDEIAQGELGNYSGVDPAIVEKIDDLRKCEDFTNIGWFSFSAWMSLPEDFRCEFTLKVDPLMWSGVYFNYAKYLEHKNAILPLLEQNIVMSLLKVFNSIEFKVVSSSGSRFYSNLSINKMKEAVKYFKDRLIVGFTVDANRTVHQLKGDRHGDSYPI